MPMLHEIITDSLLLLCERRKQFWPLIRAVRHGRFRKLLSDRNQALLVRRMVLVLVLESGRAGQWTIGVRPVRFTTSLILIAR
jgi:hypothetical protein